MAWIRCCGGVGKHFYTGIIDGGALSGAYTLSGNATQEVDSVKFTRNGDYDTSGYINSIDFTDLNTITFSIQATGSSNRVRFIVNGNTIYDTGIGSGTRNITGTLNVSNITGTYPFEVSILGATGSVKIFSFIAT